ncbi:hypothetical protein LSPCS325_16210 [Lysinibacillus sp. CTST325]
MNEQLSFLDELRKQELERPWFLQSSSAPVVRFEGNLSERNLPKGTLCFVNGSRSGEYDTHVWSRSKSSFVNYLDLVSMKVVDFTEEELTRKYPKMWEHVRIISNATLQVIDEGLLVVIGPQSCELTEKLSKGGYAPNRKVDMLTSHFEGYRPARLLIYKEDVEESAK